MRALRSALGVFATGVTVITAFEASHPVGITVNSFASVSLDPPLVLWSVAKTATCAGAFSPQSAFCVHVLAAGQDGLAMNFARSGGDKFAALAWGRSEWGAPLLPGCAAEFHCQAEASYPGGDHTIIVGRVLAHLVRDIPPLLFHRGRFREF
ncbi:MAG: flavin reductase family protein [Gammaproteobacteria bacterium]|nr:flavin reductase family protein [Gammaproteobacteria bacterium]TVQ48832.1 MAG: flavin reductase [Gammaproteobacteria bacterium]